MIKFISKQYIFTPKVLPKQTTSIITDHTSHVRMINHTILIVMIYGAHTPCQILSLQFPIQSVEFPWVAFTLINQINFINSCQTHFLITVKICTRKSIYKKTSWPKICLYVGLKNCRRLIWHIVQSLQLRHGVVHQMPHNILHRYSATTSITTLLRSNNLLQLHTFDVETDIHTTPCKFSSWDLTFN